MKYKDIATKYGVTINTVKSWKQRYAWNKKGVHTKSKKVCTQKAVKTPDTDDGTKATLQNNDLTPEQQMFCIYYIRSFNATQSYMKAFNCSYNVANAEGYKLLVKPCVKAEIDRLKEIKRQNIVCSAEDLVELNMRIAFADMGEYASFQGNYVALKTSDQTDTQLIQKVKSGKSGISIELADRYKAIDWLTKYFLLNPMDQHRQEFEQQKLEIECMKLEMQTKQEGGRPEIGENNFLAMLNASAKEALHSDETGQYPKPDKENKEQSE